ncbi:MAG: hypothetical protein JWO29_87 [Arthrobacter sp.]|nr:hypothetical protein [Arthrobacter sp.]
MFKKIAIAMTMGTLALTGCSIAPADGAASPSGQASSPATASEEAAPYEADEVTQFEANEAASGTEFTTEDPAPEAPAADGATPEPETARAPGTEPAATVPAEAPAPAAPIAAAVTAATVAAPVTAATVATPVAATRTGDGAQAATAFRWGPVVAGDEFSNTGAPDKTKWSLYNGPGHHNKGVRSPGAWSVGNGVATVSGDSAGTTGGMSAKFAQQKYGRWESRMRTSDRDPEYHPVMILWPNRGTASNCPEIDYAEGTADKTKMKFFLHYKCGGSDFQTTAAAPIDSTQWHNYAVEWTPAGITGYIDGVKTFSDTNPAHQPTVPMKQTLQLDWFPDGTATKPSQMQVDWVRVYK